jgi:uncharacterized lipoprotein NlpE involved in copper resistance
MFINSIVRVVVCISICISFVLTGCSNRASFIELKSADRRCTTQVQYLRKLPVDPDRVTVDPKTKVETWAWDTRVHRIKLDDSSEYRYGGYYADCTYEVDFDPQGNKIDSRFIGSGCFTKGGSLYQEGKIFFNENDE